MNENQNPEIIDIIIENEDEIIKNTLYEKGISQGIEQNKMELSHTKIKLLEDNLDVNTISKYTGLSIDEIEKM